MADETTTKVQEPIAPVLTDAAPAGLPDYFCCNLKCCALAIGGQGSPDCLGCSSYSHQCCFEGDNIGCKPSSDPNELCVLSRGMVKCSDFMCCPRGYQQAFCCEHVYDCNCNLDETYSKVPQGGKSRFFTGGVTGFPATTDLKVCSAMFCSTTSLFLKCPECCGTATMTQCCCCKTESVACQCCCESKICQRSECIIVPCTFMIKSISQSGCTETRCALPCDETVPCAFAQLGIMCCINWGCNPGCCVGLDQVIETAKGV